MKKGKILFWIYLFLIYALLTAFNFSVLAHLGEEKIVFVRWFIVMQSTIGFRWMYLEERLRKVDNERPEGFIAAVKQASTAQLLFSIMLWFPALGTTKWSITIGQWIIDLLI